MHLLLSSRASFCKMLAAFDKPPAVFICSRCASGVDEDDEDSSNLNVPIVSCVCVKLSLTLQSRGHIRYEVLPFVINLTVFHQEHP